MTSNITDANDNELFSIKSIDESNKTNKSRSLTMSSEFHNSNGSYYLIATANFVVVNQASQILIGVLSIIIIAVLFI